MGEYSVYRLKLDAFRRWLLRNNTVLLDPRADNEAIRFATNKSDGVVHLGKGGNAYFANPEADYAIQHFLRHEQWNGPVKRELRSPEVRRQLVTFIAGRDHGLECAYCGKKLTVSSATIEHLIPLRMDGPDNPSNMILSCKACNQLAGCKSPVNKIKVLRERFMQLTANKDTDMEKYGVDPNELDEEKTLGAADIRKKKDNKSEESSSKWKLDHKKEKG